MGGLGHPVCLISPNTDFFCNSVTPITFYVGGAYQTFGRIMNVVTDFNVTQLVVVAYDFFRLEREERWVDEVAEMGGTVFSGGS